MTRIPAILILLCLSTLLASCGVGTNSTPGRVVAVEQARAEADAQLALASQALVDAEAAAEAATQAHLAAEAAATRAAEYAVLSRDEGEAASVFAGDSPWLDEWLMTEWVIPLREVQTALAEIDDALKRAQGAEDAARHSAGVAVEVVAILDALAEEFRIDELRAALEHASSTLKKIRDAVAVSEHANFGVHAALAEADAHFEAISSGEVWSLYTTPSEVAERYYARMQALAGRFAALAAETDPDEFPYLGYEGCEPIFDCYISLPEGFEDLHVSLLDVGGEWTGKVMGAVEILGPEEAEARRQELAEMRQALEAKIASVREHLGILYTSDHLYSRQYVEAREDELERLEYELVDVEYQLPRIVDTPQRLTVYSHPDFLKFGWWWTASEDPENVRFDTFTSGFIRLHLVGNVETLTGTATYEGPAAGLYVERPSGTGNARKGLFTATVALTADFGAVGTIGGAVSDFREDGLSLGAWTVDLMSASLLAETDAFSFKGAIGGEVDSRTWDDGNWTGGFFDWTEGDHPSAVLGEFHATTGTPQSGDGDAGFIGLSGAFGAHATSE